MKFNNLIRYGGVFPPPLSFKILDVIPNGFLNKTISGFATHMAAEITSYTLHLLLRLQFRIDVQTFQSATSFLNLIDITCKL